MIGWYKLLLAGLGFALATWAAPAMAEDDRPPGVQALDEVRNGEKPEKSVQNRFFLKSKRFEITPLGGTVPTNPFASRFTVSLNFGYHFTETLAFTGIFSYAPDLGKRDVKSLVPILLQRATDDDFRQPLDKVTLSAAFGLRWSPVYGKINILGEIVANFDFFVFIGLGLAVQNEYAAIENPTFADGQPTTEFFNLESQGTEVRFAPQIGLGGNFFITNFMALRLDGRFTIFPDDKPVYDPAEPPTGMRAVSMFTAQAGLAFWIPKMKPRLTDF